MSKTCPHCGALSEDSEWCDVCGGDLREQGDAQLSWLEVGDPVSFTLDDKKRMARVVDVLEAYTTRRVLQARVCPEGKEADYFTPQELEGIPQDEPTPISQTQELPVCEPDWLLLQLEETEEDNTLEPDVLPESVRHLVHLPITQVERGAQRRLEVYHAPPGQPLQEFLESQGRLLKLEEASKLTELLLDAVELIHEAGLYHFQICPWTIRLSLREDLAQEDLILEHPIEDLRLTFESIRGFYDAEAPLESHPVIMGFSPPEFFRRSPGPLNHRADLFGVGMLFYYLLAGTPPPTGALTRHRPYLPVRAFRFGLMPGLQAFVEGCTALNPAERFEHVAQARESLHKCMATEAMRHLDNGPAGSISTFCAVDRHIGIGKGRRTPVNQDGVFLGHAPQHSTALIAVADGVSTASFGSGDVASKLLVEAAAEAWRELLRDPNILKQLPEDSQDNEPLKISGIDHTLDDPQDLDSQDESSIEPPSSDEAFAPTLPDMPTALAAEDADPDSEQDEGASDAPEDNEVPQEALDEAQATLPSIDEDPSLEIVLESQEESVEEDEFFEGEEDDDEPTAIPMGRLSLVGHRTGPVEMDTPAAYLLRSVLQRSNEAISDFINERFAPFDGPVHEVMGTTAVLASIYKDQVTIASLGDSRAYLLRDGHMECLTRDHNLATMRILEGFPADECLSLPQGMALARCLGTFEIKGGTLNAVHPEPDLMTFRLLPGDTLLLTTDGLIDFAGATEAVAERNIQDVLEAEEIPSIACLKLMLLANEGGGEDNIGLSIIRVTERQLGQRPMLYQAFPPVRGMSPGDY